MALKIVTQFFLLSTEVLIFSIRYKMHFLTSAHFFVVNRSLDLLHSIQVALLDLGTALSHGTVSHPPMPFQSIHYIPRHRPPHAVSARRDPVLPSTRATHPQAVRVAQEHIARAHIARAESDDTELSRAAAHSPRAGPERV